MAARSLGVTSYWWCLPTVRASRVTAWTWHPKQLCACVHWVEALARYSSPRCAAWRAAGSPADGGVVGVPLVQTRGGGGAGGPARTGAANSERTTNEARQRMQTSE